VELRSDWFSPRYFWLPIRERNSLRKRCLPRPVCGSDVWQGKHELGSDTLTNISGTVGHVSNNMRARFAAARGGTDIAARPIGPSLSERLGRSFLIENRPGGNNNIGTEAPFLTFPGMVSAWICSCRPRKVCLKARLSSLQVQDDASRVLQPSGLHPARNCNAAGNRRIGPDNIRRGSQVVGAAYRVRAGGSDRPDANAGRRSADNTCLENAACRCRRQHRR
jgi:hypothetical protein